LLVNPNKEGLDTLEELIKFYNSHYSANLMQLVVYGKGFHQTELHHYIFHLCTNSSNYYFFFYLLCNLCMQRVLTTFKILLKISSLMSGILEGKVFPFMVIHVQVNISRFIFSIC
jgi:hypothetical protein